MMKNKYRIEGDTTYIIIPYKDQVFETTIHTSDLNKVLTYSMHWNIKDDTKNSGGYRVLGRVKNASGEVLRTSLHRFLMSAPNDLQVDHIDNNSLNNRTTNLRLATPQQNQQNRAGAMRNSKSGIRGVSYQKENGWRAQIAFYGKQQHLGWFSSKEAAEIEVKRARAEYYSFSKEGMARSLEAA